MSPYTKTDIERKEVVLFCCCNIFFTVYRTLTFSDKTVSAITGISVIFDCDDDGLRLASPTISIHAEC